MKKKKNRTPYRSKHTSKKKKKCYMANNAVKNSGQNFEEKMRDHGKQLLEALKNKNQIQENMQTCICEIEKYFRTYDTIQLLGGIGLRLFDNLPNLEKKFMSSFTGKQFEFDEDAEVIAEYALNFGLSMPNENIENPTDEIIDHLYHLLKNLKGVYAILDMPLEADDDESSLKWFSHSNTIEVRGDGYMQHIEEVFHQLFTPHSPYFEAKFGFSVDELFEFCTTIEKRIMSKIGGQNNLTGLHYAWERWRNWEKQNHGSETDMQSLMKRDFSKGLFGEFFESNPDMGNPSESEKFVLYQSDDFSKSDMIFWIVPLSETEHKILETLSVSMGSNDAFIKDGEYKGNIMNGQSIFVKPIIKVGDKYLCFTPLLLYRNMITIAENLIKQDDNYYNVSFKSNKSPISRDNFIEHKVKEQLELFMPNVMFYSSVSYPIIVDGKNEKAELDILGVSEKCTYIVEVKAHELTHKDRVGINGLKSKFLGSVTEACSQSKRAKEYIESCDAPKFGSAKGEIKIDPSKPIYKIAVTFQHYSALLGNMSMLIKLDLMREDYRDTWIVSLYDIMVIADFCDNEDEFIAYLDLRMKISSCNTLFFDELDLYGQFINNDLSSKLAKGKKVDMILGGSEFFDEEYSSDFDLPIKPKITKR